jgi:hypothetical protein
MAVASSRTSLLGIVMKSLEVWVAYGDTAFLLREESKIKKSLLHNFLMPKMNTVPSELKTRVFT